MLIAMSPILSAAFTSVSDVTLASFDATIQYENDASSIQRLGSHVCDCLCSSRSFQKISKHWFLSSSRLTIRLVVNLD